MGDIFKKFVAAHWKQLVFTHLEAEKKYQKMVRPRQDPNSLAFRQSTQGWSRQEPIHLISSAPRPLCNAQRIRAYLPLIIRDTAAIIPTRRLPLNPAWYGYSLGKWEGDT